MSASDNFYKFEGASRPTITDYLEHGHVGGTDGGAPYKSVSNPPQIINIDDSTAGTTYFGYASVGTATSASTWRIMRMVESSGVTTMTFADGNSNWDNVWDNRGSLSYS